MEQDRPQIIPGNCTATWRWLPWLFFLFAFFLRAWEIGYVHFGIDEATAAAVSTQIAQGRYFPLTGIETSFGFHNPPLFLYLLAPFFGVSSDPRLAQLAIACFGAAAVFPMWGAGRILGGRVGAIVAALLVAVCPNAVEHSRRLWGPDLILPLACISIYAAIACTEKKDWRLLALSLAAAATAQSLHLSGGLLWVFGGVVLWRSRPQYWPRAIVAAFAALVALYLPWLINEATNGFPDIGTMVEQVAAGGGQRELGHPVHPIAAWALVLGDFWENDLLGWPRSWMVSPVAAVAVCIQSVSALALLGLGLAGAVRFHSLSRHPEWRDMLLAGILLPLIAFGFILTAAVPHYLLPALPPVLIAATAMLSHFWKQRAGRHIVIAILTVYTGSALVTTTEVRRQLLNGAGTSVPLVEKMAAIDEVAERTGTRPYYLMQDGRPPESGVDYAYAYLLYWREINEQATSGPEPGTAIYVIVDRRSRLRPVPALYLRQVSSRTDLPHLILYRLDPPSGLEWATLTRQHPPPR